MTTTATTAHVFCLATQFKFPGMKEKRKEEKKKKNSQNNKQICHCQTTSPLFLFLSVSLCTRPNFIFHFSRAMMFLHLVAESLNWLLCFLKHQVIDLCVYFLHKAPLSANSCLFPLIQSYTVSCSLTNDSITVQSQSQLCQLSFFFFFFKTASHYSTGVLRKSKVYCFQCGFCVCVCVAISLCLSD